MSEKRLLDYFIEHTDKRFDETHRRIDRLTVLVIASALIFICFSPAGPKILDLVPKAFEAAAAFAGVR